MSKCTPPGGDPLSYTPTGKPRARSLGIGFHGTPGSWNAITDVPGVEVGYVTLIEGDHIRTGVTAIHPRGKHRPGEPVTAVANSLVANEDMTGRDGHRTPALPRDMAAALIARAGSG